MNMNGVHCQISVMMTAGRASPGVPSQTIGSNPKRETMWLIKPKLASNRYRQSKPTTTGAIMMGMIKTVRRTTIPFIPFSRRNAIRSPKKSSAVTAKTAKMRVTLMELKSAGSCQAQTKFSQPIYLRDSIGVPRDQS
ncbi:MAG: hypothetical protein EHM27_14600 [Deltaproteobacteria bacterium]|nr:MAG: hypothetical protein EHM27_14600 [Deltaproteobacteria bacterium]